MRPDGTTSALPDLRAAPSVPTHRQLNGSASAAWGVPRLPGPVTIAVAALIVAVVLAVGAAVLPFARLPLILLTVLVAAPASVVALRRSPSMPGERRDLASIELDASLTDPVTGAGNAAALDAALDAAVLDPAALPLAVVRLALLGSAATDGADDAQAAERRRLVLAAIHWREILRPGDLLVRTAGAELAVVLPRCDARATKAVVDRLCAASPDNAVIAGVAHWDGEEPPTSLLRRAEAILERERAAAGTDPITDPGRVAAVAATGLTTRQPVDAFSEIASGLAGLLHTPIVIISLFDEHWQHFIGEHGVLAHGGSLEGTSISDSICRTTVATGHPLVVSDTRRHPALQSVPAARDLGVLACASLPIVDAGGHVLGSVCAMVLERHAWNADDVALLKIAATRIGERLSELPMPVLATA